MVPTVKPYVGRPDEPNEIVVSISIPRSAADYSEIKESFSALKDDLGTRWPVQSVSDSNSRQNPVDLKNWVIPIVIGLAGPLLRPMGEKLRDEVFDWYRRRFKRPAKRKKRPLK
jgi:hypothetical protein